MDPNRTTRPLIWVGFGYDFNPPKKFGLVLGQAQTRPGPTRGHPYFLPHEASTILSIPISQNLLDDAWVWAWTKKGIFSVKSAYHVALGWLSEGRSLGTGGEESNRQKKKKFWTSIWSL